MWNLLLSTWVLWLPLLLLFFARLSVEQRRQARLAASGIADIDQMDGRAFEECLASLFRRLGYTVELTRYVGDWGGDLVLQKDGIRTVVQAKRYSKKVGVRAVQEVVAAKAKYRCTETLVVTNNLYTQQARELARDNHVTLWDRDHLINALLQANTGDALAPAPTHEAPAANAGDAPPQPVPTAMATLSTSAVPPICCICHKPVSEKVAAYCQEKSDRFGGHTYCFDHQRSIRTSRRTLQADTADPVP